MAAWNNGVVVEHRQWSPTLRSLYIESEIEPYQAGQFVKIGLELDGDIVSRPFSLCNAPTTQPLEVYYVEIPDGALTPQLAKLKIGDQVLVAPRAYGFLVLDEVPAARHLWLMATGTGIGPFLAILDTAELWQRYERVTLVFAVRTLADLSYQERLQALLERHYGQFVFLPMVSREAVDPAVYLTGRMPASIDSGELEERAGVRFSVQDSQVMLCGNPQMIEDVMRTLALKGLRKHRRRNPGQITTEHYW